MRKPEDWNGSGEYPPPPNPDVAQENHEQWKNYGVPQTGPLGYPMEGQRTIKKKRKWVAGLLAFFIPGIGHMYLELMVKGIVLMLLVAFDITAIVYASNEEDNVLSVVLLCLLLPIIYFYNLFDAIQSTDLVNDRKAAVAASPYRGVLDGDAVRTIEESLRRGGLPPAGILLLAIAGVVIILAAGMNWTGWLFDSFGSILGAAILIGAGVGLWFWEMKGHQRKGN